MSKNAAIEIFLRVRPTKKKSEKFHVIPEDAKAIFTSMKQMKKSEYVNNTRNEYNYCFNGVFGMESKQEDVFEKVAKDVIDNAFEGFNGTIFAYGQTGSGKTYTMTGERYADRGIIPRTISYIFSEANRRTDTEFNININYLEIYNNEGYDLLSEEHSNTYKELSDLPKVVPLERGNGELMLSGLTTHRVAKEEDALNLLFIGDTNRAVCETPMNDASTRSHCIFIITIESRKLDSDVKTISKVHLVDLSGSERVGKTGINGVLLKEACYINLSLHYLEQVINSLQKKMSAPNPEEYFVPYRNSLMTMVLRDSLGGNCKTRMISTIHVEDDYLDESISTCNFSMRVAMIKNTVTKNEAVDPNIIISRLKRENQELRAEISMLRGGNVKTELSGEDIARCSKIVHEFVHSRDPTQKIILSDPLMIAQCFTELKTVCNNRPANESLANSTLKPQKEVVFKEDTEKVRRLEEEILKLKLVLKQRENEIMIFLNMINKKAAEHQDVQSAHQPGRAATPPQSQREMRVQETKDNLANLRQTQELRFPEYSQKEEDSNYQMVYSVMKKDGSMLHYKSGDRPDSSYKPNNKINDQSNTLKISEPASQIAERKHTPVNISKTGSLVSGKQNSAVSKQMADLNKLLSTPLSLTKDQLLDRQHCFEAFRNSYRKSEALEEYHKMLKELGEKGKAEAEIVKQVKSVIDMRKSRIEDIRKVQALQGMKQGGTWTRSPEEEALLLDLETHKKTLSTSFEKVKEVKDEIDRVKVHYKNGMMRLNEDFKKWLYQMMVEMGVNVSKMEQSQATKENKDLPGDVTGVSTYNSTTANDQNTSLLSKATATIRNPKVKHDLEEFFKAKEDINRKLNAGLSGN